MRYLDHYERLIARARERLVDGYKERHHILPRCMGGGDELSNLVDLTAEEHYVAHQLLTRIHPSARGLATAAVRMAKQCTGNKAYGWLRRRHARDVSVRQTGNTYNVGRVRPDHEREKISATMKGVRKSDARRARRGNRHALGLIRGPMSDDHRANLKAALKDRKPHALSDEARQKISIARKAYWHRIRNERHRSAQP